MRKAERHADYQQIVSNETVRTQEKNYWKIENVVAARPKPLFREISGT